MFLYLYLDENEPVRQPFPAMPPPSGRAMSHVWSFFYKSTNRQPGCFLMHLSSL